MKIGKYHTALQLHKVPCYTTTRGKPGKPGEEVILRIHRSYHTALAQLLLDPRFQSEGWVQELETVSSCDALQAEYQHRPDALLY